MPASTPLGIIYPCGGDTIDCDVFAGYANSTQAALTDTDDLVADALGPPAVLVRQFLSQTIPVGVATPLAYALEGYDTSDMFTLAAPTIFTVTQPGTYLVNLIADWGSFAGTFTSARAAILRNGVEYAFLKSDAGTVAGTANDPLFVTTMLAGMTAGEQISSSVLYTGTLTATVFATFSATRISTN